MPETTQLVRGRAGELEPMLSRSVMSSTLLVTYPLDSKTPALGPLWYHVDLDNGSSRAAEAGMNLSGQARQPWGTLLRYKQCGLSGLTLGGHRGILWFREGQGVAWSPTASCPGSRAGSVLPFSWGRGSLCSPA